MFWLNKLHHHPPLKKSFFQNGLLLITQFGIVVLLLPPDLQLRDHVLRALAHVPRAVHVRQSVKVARVPQDDLAVRCLSSVQVERGVAE